MYRWDIEYLNKLLLEYEQKACEADSKKQMLEFDKTVASIEEILEYHAMYFEDIENLCEGENTEDKVPLKKIVASDKELFKNYKPYLIFLRNFVNSLEGLVVDNNPRFTRIKVASNQIVNIGKDFYEQHKGEIRDAFEEIYRTLPSHLEFRKVNNTGTLFAQTFNVYGTNESFFDIGLVRNAQDYITLIHEFGHGIANLLSPGFLWDRNKYCFVETDTLFWELVGEDYISSSLGLKDSAHHIALANLREYLYDADLMCSKQDIYSKFNSNDLSNKKLLRRYLKNEMGYDNLAVNHTLYSMARDEIHYIISYLTATELYLIYQVDKKTALDLLVKIIKVKGLSSKGYLEYIKSLGIVPGEHIKEYVQQLINRGRDLGYGKELYYRH